MPLQNFKRLLCKNLREFDSDPRKIRSFRFGWTAHLTINRTFVFSIMIWNRIKFSLFEMYSKKLLMNVRYQAPTRIECLLGLYFLLDSEGLMWNVMKAGWIQNDKRWVWSTIDSWDTRLEICFFHRRILDNQILSNSFLHLYVPVQHGKESLCVMFANTHWEVQLQNIQNIWENLNWMGIIE